MYRLSLLFICVTALAVVSGYIPGREYEYEYHGYAATGFPDKKPQYATVGFNGLIRFQPKADGSIIIKLVKLAHDTQNGEIEDLSHHHYEYKDLDHNSALFHPYKAYFKNGQVTHFETEKGEPVFAVNIKRALLSLLNLHLDEIENPEAATKDNEIYQPDYSPHYYKVSEDGIMGECETAYVIEHHPYHLTPHNNIVLNITKSPNYHKCTKTPNHVYSTFYGNECPLSEHAHSHTLHGNGHVTYDIRGDRHHFVIEEIVTEGEIVYTPYPLDGQSAEVSTNRTLHLVEEREHPEEEYHMPADVDTHYDLHYEVPFKTEFKADIDMKKPHYLYHVYGQKYPIEEIETRIEHLQQVYDDPTYHKDAKDMDHPAEFLEVLRAVGTLDYDDIDKLYKRYADVHGDDITPQQIRERGLFYDLLVSAGTNPSIEYAKDLIHARKIPHYVVMYIIQNLQHHVKEVSEKLLDELHDLCEDEYIREFEHLRATCYLTLTSIVYDHCVAKYHPESLDEHDKYSCPYDVPTKYYQYIADHLHKARDEYEEIAYIRAAANLGVKESLRDLRHYIEGHVRESQLVRVNSIYATSNIGHRYPELVRHILVPIFHNHSENYEVRLSAFSVLMQLRPEMHAYESIARSLIEEEDDQVRSFVYSYFRHHANSTHPCDHAAAKNSRYALYILKHYHDDFDHYDYSYSTFHYSGGYNEHYDYGGHSEFSYFANDDGYIPRALYIDFNDFIGGKSYDSFGFLLHQYGLEKIFDKLVGPESSLGKRTILDLLKVQRRKTRDISNVDKELGEIQEKLHLHTKEYGPISGEAAFYFMGNTYNFFYFNDTTFENFFKQGKFPLPSIPDTYMGEYQRYALQMDKMYYIPSECGVPIIMDYKQPAYYYHHFNKVSFTPDVVETKGGDEVAKGAEIDVDGHVIFDKNLFASIGIMLPSQKLLLNAGINRRVTVSLPLKINTHVDMKEHKFQFKWEPVDHQVYHFDYEPYTVLDHYDKLLPVTEEESYKPVRRIGHRQDVEKHLFEDALGVGLKIKKNYDSEWMDQASWYRFFTEKSFREQFYYLYANPQFEPIHYDAYIERDHEHPTNEVDVEFTYSCYKDNQPHDSHLKDAGFTDPEELETDRPLLTTVVTAEVVAKGPKERKVFGEVIYHRDVGRFYNKLEAYYERTPFARHETDNLKVCISGYAKFPHYDLLKIFNLETVGMERGMDTGLHAYFGKDCSTHQKIDMKVRHEQSEEQNDLEHRREEPDTPEHYNPYSHYYHECLRERQELHQNFGEHCMEYFYLALHAHKHVYDIHYENLSPRFLNATYKVARYFRHLLYPYSDHDELDVHNKEGNIHAEFNVSQIHPVMDIRIKKPHANSHYTHVYVPEEHGVPVYPFHQDWLALKSLNELYCQVDGNHVYTFDHYAYDLPEIDCYKVIAKDCSPNHHFTVLASKIEHARLHKTVKVFLGQHKVEFLPLTADSNLVVRVDGKVVDVTDKQPYFHEDDDDHKHSDFNIQLRDFFYALVSEKYGIVVETDGNFVVVQVSPYYRAKLCGLCGNYNGQRYDRYEVKDGCYPHNEESFAYSYTINTETCHTPAPQFDCPAEQGHVGCTELKTHIVELTKGGVAQTCFSTEPIPHCRTGCTTSGHVTRTLGYHCLPTKDDSTKGLVRQSEHRVIYEVRRKSKDHEADAEVDESCHH